ncbi:hypothetical protein [Mycolicibacterium goodii]|uniref:hypothetical protein n=1 Tax=Mycolicibacterium goodii TaxID=134601 RepID=UPI001BDC2E31|nr:hypothetical protein [Mycolicibacterium goodii]MBU8841178.1 hypothetical protein [Mycolicibacterium goodii]
MADGYWVISVDRETGRATTSELITDTDEAWQLSLDLQNPATYTTVVSRRIAPPTPSRQIRN